MPHDREYWRRHMLAHRRSRLTQTAYCLQNGLHTKTYRTWCRKLEAVGEVEPIRASIAEAGAMDGIKELAYPLLPALPSGRTELVGTVAQRQRYTVEERQQHVLMALQSGLPIERYARMAGLTPSALHRWKHKYAVHVGAVSLMPRAATPAPLFASVTVADTADNVPCASKSSAGSPAAAAAAWNSVDIILGNGRRLTVDVRVDEVALRRLLAVLEPPA